MTSALPSPLANESSTCFLCTAANGDRMIDDAVDRGQRSWYDDIVVQTSRAFSILGVGALTEGYFLVSPTTHAESVAQLDDENWLDFSRCLQATIDLCLDRFGPPVFFEHGGSSQRGSISSCVDHAHLHVFPLANRIQLQIGGPSQQFETFEHFGRHRQSFSTTPYLLCSNDGASCAVAEDTGERQFFRRQIAQAVNLADEWDYAAFPRYETMRNTLDRLVG